jgi:hypothetical protein
LCRYRGNRGAGARGARLSFVPSRRGGGECRFNRARGHASIERRRRPRARSAFRARR